MGMFNIFGRGSGFLRYLLLVGLLSKTDYGLITYAFSIGEIGRNFMDWGLDNLVSRDGAREHKKIPAYLFHGIILKAGLGVLLFIFAFAYLHFYRELPWNSMLVVYAALCGSAMLSMTGVLRSCFTANEQMHYVFYTNLPVRLVSLGTLFVVLWLGLPVIWAAGAVSFENVLWFILLGFFALKSFSLRNTPFSFSFIKYMLITSLPLGLYQFFNNMYINLDVIMIESIMGGLDHVSPYTYASYFLKGVLMLLSGYMIAIYPALSRYHKTDEAAYQRLFRQSVFFLLSLTIPGSVMMVFWAEGWMNLVTETDTVTTTVFQILSITMNISVLNTLAIIVFTSRDRQWWLVGFCGLGVGISFCLNWLMIPHFAQIGAAYASLLSQSILFLFMAAILTRNFSLQYPVIKPLGILLCSFMASFILRLLPEIHILLVPFLFAIVIGLLILLFRVMTMQEIKDLWKSIRKKD